MVEYLRYVYEKKISSQPLPCPGFYCGRILYSNGSFSRCGPCPRGFKRTEFFECVLCENDLSFYDWLYLGFMGMLPIVLHLSSMDRKREKTKDTLALVVCAILEVVFAGGLTLLCTDPHWSFRIRSCGVFTLSDWYPLFHNPEPNYEEVIHCSHEVVYPLYTLLLLFYGIGDAIMLLLRIPLHYCGIAVKDSIYWGMYFYPVLGLTHVTLGGILYSVFPYSLLLGSVISCAFHFAKRENQTVRGLVLESVRDWRNGGLIILHWFLHAYGIVGVTELEDSVRDMGLLALIPLPSLLYVGTVSFTDPAKLHGD